MRLKELYNKNSNILYLVALFGFSTLVLLINMRINVFRYENFDMGKFDLGNMSQMVYNTLNGRFMYVTDYFGTNMPRWGMSHVDPILLIFVPIYAIYAHPLVLVFGQLIAIIYSALIIYFLARLKLKSNFAAFILSVAFLFYPALGFVTAWTGYHGVSIVIPFFLGAFFVLEYMHEKKNYSKWLLVVFWALIILFLAGKEQISLFVSLIGVYTFFVHKRFSLGASLFIVGMFWFFMTFFVIIPSHAHYRIEGFQKFEQSLGIKNQNTRDVESKNFFLQRYEAFGDSYFEIAFNMITKPQLLLRVMFSGDKIENFRMTLEPVGYLPFFAPHVFMLSSPDFLINYATSQDGLPTAEIYTHRISLIIPVMFMSVIFAIILLSNNFEFLFKKPKIYAIWFLSVLLLILNIQKTFEYKNPVFLWLVQAIEKRVFAKTVDLSELSELKVGERIRLSPLDDNDRECAQKIVDLIPPEVSVSGPDHLGAHLSLRETYGIFPSLYNEAEYVIVDVFSRKVLTVIGIDDNSLIREVAGKLIKSDNYELVTGCANLFVFKKTDITTKPDLLPIQERLTFEEKVDYEIFESLTVVDFQIPSNAKKSELINLNITMTKRENNSLDGYVMFLSFVNKETGDTYQIANFPSFALREISDWVEDRYYLENFEIGIPEFLSSGDYMVFIGIDNKIRTRSIYLGDISIQ